MSNGRDEGLAHPERVGPYELLLPIASGGMATVYLGRKRGARGFEREVAIKLTHAHLRQSHEFAAELLEEAKLAVRIRHPNVVSVIDAGDDSVGLYLAMDYVEGDSLAGLIRRARMRGEMLPPAVGLRVLIDALEGLHAAHELTNEAGELVGIVHRDFSPQNILVGVDGRSRLTDFGIAKASSRLSHTVTGMVKGKINYMAPEQARSAKVDRRTDVWAAGVIAWELFAGHRMYQGREGDFATLIAIATEPPPALRDVAPDVHADFLRVLASALEPDIEARCPDAETFGERLEEVARQHLQLPDRKEVAEYVKRLSGDKLAERRARASEVAELRAKVNQLVATEVEANTTASTPASVAASEEPVAISVTLKLPPESAPTIRAETERWPLSHSRMRAAVVIALAFVATAVTWCATRPSEPTLLASWPIDMAPTLPSAGPSAAPHRVVVTKLHVEANAPIARLFMNDEPIAIDRPARVFELDVRDLDPASVLKAVSIDGRSASSPIKRGSKGASATFMFGSMAAPAKSADALPIPKNPYELE